MSQSKSEPTSAKAGASRDAETSQAPAPEIAVELDELRSQIDAIDAEILDRLNRRAGCVQRVGELKDGGRKGPIYVAARERDLVRALVEAA